jgi:hypothetical protein
MSRFRDSRGFERRALRAAGVLLLVLISMIALTLACTSEQDDDVTTTALILPLEPPHVIDRLVAPQPPPALSLPIPPAYQPPRNA